MLDLAKQARLGHARGWAFTPLDGKVPQLSGWQQADPPELERVLRWCRTKNLGLRTGQVSGVAVIDIDPGAPVGPEDFPLTVSVLTPRNGWHLYYTVAEGEAVKNRAGTLVWPASGERIAHVDVRGDGGQVVYPGSTVNGKQYIWQNHPDQVAMAPFPTQYLPTDDGAGNVASQTKPAPATATGLSPYYASVLNNSVNKVALAPEGQRHETLNRMAYHLGGFIAAGCLDHAQVEQRLWLASEENGLSNDPHGNAWRTIKDGISAGMQKPHTIEPDFENQPQSQQQAADPPHDAWCECPACVAQAQPVESVPECEF